MSSGSRFSQAILCCCSGTLTSLYVCVQEAKSIGDEFLALEKYVNLNYMGFHKILVRA